MGYFNILQGKPDDFFKSVAGFLKQAEDIVGKRSFTNDRADDLREALANLRAENEKLSTMLKNIILPKEVAVDEVDVELEKEKHTLAKLEKTLNVTNLQFQLDSKQLLANFNDVSLSLQQLRERRKSETECKSLGRASSIFENDLDSVMNSTESSIENAGVEPDTYTKSCLDKLKKLKESFHERTVKYLKDHNICLQQIRETKALYQDRQMKKKMQHEKAHQSRVSKNLAWMIVRVYLFFVSVQSLVTLLTRRENHSKTIPPKMNLALSKKRQGVTTDRKWIDLQLKVNSTAIELDACLDGLWYSPDTDDVNQVNVRKKTVRALYVANQALTVEDLARNDIDQALQSSHRLSCAINDDNHNRGLSSLTWSHHRDRKSQSPRINAAFRFESLMNHDLRPATIIAEELKGIFEIIKKPSKKQDSNEIQAQRDLLQCISLLDNEILHYEGNRVILEFNKSLSERRSKAAGGMQSDDDRYLAEVKTFSDSMHGFAMRINYLREELVLIKIARDIGALRKMDAYKNYQAKLKAEVEQARDELLAENGCFRFFRYGSSEFNDKLKKLRERESVLSQLCAGDLLSVKNLLTIEITQEIDEQNRLGANLKLPEMRRHFEDEFMLTHAEMKEVLQQQYHQVSKKFLSLADKVIVAANKALITCSSASNRDSLQQRLDNVCEKLNAFYYVEKETDTHIPFTCFVREMREQENAAKVVRRAS